METIKLLIGYAFAICKGVLISYFIFMIAVFLYIIYRFGTNAYYEGRKKFKVMFVTIMILFSCSIYGGYILEDWKWGILRVYFNVTNIEYSKTYIDIYNETKQDMKFEYFIQSASMIFTILLSSYFFGYFKEKHEYLDGWNKVRFKEFVEAQRKEEK